MDELTFKQTVLAAVKLSDADKITALTVASCNQCTVRQPADAGSSGQLQPKEEQHAADRPVREQNEHLQKKEKLTVAARSFSFGTSPACIRGAVLVACTLLTHACVHLSMVPGMAAVPQPSRRCRACNGRMDRQRHGAHS